MRRVHGGDVSHHGKRQPSLSHHGVYFGARMVSWGTEIGQYFSDFPRISLQPIGVAERPGVPPMNPNDKEYSPDSNVSEADIKHRKILAQENKKQRNASTLKIPPRSGLFASQGHFHPLTWLAAMTYGSQNLTPPKSVYPVCVIFFTHPDDFKSYGIPFLASL